jgi:hypothetical protein
MNKFRVVVRGEDGRRHTRHVRATDELHAQQQARAIALVLGGGRAVVGTVERMGRVESIQRGGGER